MEKEQMEWFCLSADELGNLVYDSLLDGLLPEYRLEAVQPVFVPGEPCFEAYHRMLSAYERLRTRLGVEDEDADAEEMIDNLLEHGRLLAMEMFRYGMRYQKMQDEIQKPGA